MILPLASGERGLVYFSPRVSLADEGQGDFGLTLGLRSLILPGLALGGALFTDVIETRHDNRLSRWGLGVELFSEWVDFHANWYDVPSSPKMIGEYAEQTRTVSSRTTASTRVTQSGTGDHYEDHRWERKDDPKRSPSREIKKIELNGPSATLKDAQGNQLVGRDYERDVFHTTTRYATTYTTRTTTTTITDWFERFEGAGDGWDAEVGFRVPWPGGPEFRVYGGWYSFENPFGPDVEGWKARAEFRPGPWLALEGGLYEDDRLTGSDWFVGFRMSIPLTGDLSWADVREGLFGGRARTVNERMGSESPARDALRARESGWIENPARQQVEKKVEESRRTEHYSESETSDTGWELTKEQDKFSVGETGTLATVSATGTADMQLTNAAGATQTVTVTSVVSNAPTITGALSTGTTVFVTEGGTYNEQVTIASGQTLTSELHVEGVGTLRSETVPHIKASAAYASVVTMESGSTLHRVNVTNETNFGTYVDSNGIKVTPGGGTGETVISNSEVTNKEGRGVEIYVEGSGATMGAVTIRDSTITGGSSHGVWTRVAAPLGTPSATMGDLTVSNSTITASKPNMAGVFVHVDGMSGSTMGAMTIDNVDKITGAWFDVKRNCDWGATCGTATLDGKDYGTHDVNYP